MDSWDRFDEIDYKATVTALTEANQMVFATEEEKSKWIDVRSALIFFDLLAKSENK